MNVLSGVLKRVPENAEALVPALVLVHVTVVPIIVRTTLFLIVAATVLALVDQHVTVTVMVVSVSANVATNVNLVAMVVKVVVGPVVLVPPIQAEL